MPLSSARGHPDLSTGRITDFSTFSPVYNGPDGKPSTSSDPAYHRLTNAYGNQQSKANLTPDEQRQWAIFETDKLELMGAGFSNPKLWLRLKLLGREAFIKSMIDKMK